MGKGATHMWQKINQRKGFSLVELVIVVVILGIIAAIAIPRISSGSKNAGESALRANLATLRNSIDWYYGEHYATFPGVKAAGGANGEAGTVEALVSQLTMYSKADGTVSADKDPAFPYGPYIRGEFPNLPVGTNAGESTVTVLDQITPLASTPADGKGWVYNLATGQIIANASETSAEGTTYDGF